MATEDALSLGDAAWVMDYTQGRVSQLLVPAPGKDLGELTSPQGLPRRGRRVHHRTIHTESIRTYFDSHPERQPDPSWTDRLASLRKVGGQPRNSVTESLHRELRDAREAASQLEASLSRALERLQDPSPDSPLA